MDLTGIKERIKCMTREEKIEEIRIYLVSSGLLNLDVDLVMADQAAVGAPDSALDDALLRCARLAGSVLGREPMLAQEFVEALKGQRPAIRRWQSQAIGLSEPRFSLRRSR